MIKHMQNSPKVQVRGTFASALAVVMCDSDSDSDSDSGSDSDSDSDRDSDSDSGGGGGGSCSPLNWRLCFTFRGHEGNLSEYDEAAHAYSQQ